MRREVNRRWLELWASTALFATGLAVGQSDGPLRLEIQPGPPVEILVKGKAGAPVEVQHSAALGPSARWSALENFLLGTQPQSVLAPTSGYYRADGSDWAPASLPVGGQFYLQVPGATAPLRYTLVIDGPDTGWWLDQSSPTSSGLQNVRYSYRRVDATKGVLSLPMGGGNVALAAQPHLMPQTNEYVLSFAGHGQGEMEFAQAGITNVGSFNYAAGESASAPAELQPNEIYQFEISAGAIGTNKYTFVAGTSGKGWLMGPGSNAGNAPELRGVQVEYRPLGSLAAELKIAATNMWELGMPRSPTNTYTLVFTSSTGGLCEVSDGMMIRSGAFSRNADLVGQVVAPDAVVPGEWYAFEFLDAMMPEIDDLVVNSATNGLLDGSPASLSCRRLAPLIAEIQAVGPDPWSASPRTNTYQMIFTGWTNGVTIRSSDMWRTYLGTFDLARLGDLAPEQLLPGERFDFEVVEAMRTNATSLIVNSVTSGFLSQSQGGVYPGGGMSEATLHYSKLGPVVATLEAVTLDGSMTRTNTYTLMFGGMSGGECRVVAWGMAVPGWGSFSRAIPLPGPGPAPAQLQPGQTYQFVTSDGGATTNVTTLVMNTDSGGLLMQSGSSPAGGEVWSEVAWSYTRLGPSAGRLELRDDLGGGMGLATNTYTLIYRSPDAGECQVRIPNYSMPRQGTFTVAFIGAIAPAQLEPGQTYQFVTSDGGATTNVTTLVMNTDSGGLLMQSGSSPAGGEVWSEVAWSYTRLGPSAGRLKLWGNLVGSMGMGLATNTYTLIYRSPDAGECQVRIPNYSMPRQGTFRIAPGPTQPLAPAALLEGDRLRLVYLRYTPGGITTNVLRVAVTEQGFSGASPVALSYLRLGPTVAGIDVVYPQTGPMPPTTDGHLLLFTSPTNGLLSSGAFELDTSLRGLDLAPERLQAGHIFKFDLRDPMSPSRSIETTLVAESETSGQLLQSGGGSEATLTQVSLRYTKLGLQAGRIEASIPSQGGQMARTNIYTMVFDKASGGEESRMQTEMGSAMEGPFSFDTSLGGGEPAPRRLDPGESYRFEIRRGTTSTNVATVLVTSSHEGRLIWMGDYIPGVPTGVSTVGVDYIWSSGLTAQVKLEIPARPGYPATTNSYFMLYTGLMEGICRASQGTPNLGSFTRNNSVVGLEPAPAHLQPNEVFDLPMGNVLVSSESDGLLVRTGDWMFSGISRTSFTYRQMDAWTAELAVSIPSSTGMPQVTTNTLVFTGPSEGLCGVTPSGPSSSVSHFSRVTSLVGADYTPMQLEPGESYRIERSDMPSTTNFATLTVNSSTSCVLAQYQQGGGGMPATGSSMSEVTLEYQRLSPLAAQLVVTIPGASGMLPTTNTYLLVYDGPTAGDCQGRSLGRFTRNISLVGKNLAPTQVQPGENYRLWTLSGPGMASTTTLVANSTTNGMLAVRNYGSAQPIQDVRLAYERLGPAVAKLTLLIPTTDSGGLRALASPNSASTKTNSYLLVFEEPDAGHFLGSGDGQATSGSFERDASLVGKEVAPDQLQPGEHYQFATTDGMASTNFSTLLVNAVGSGLLMQTGTGPADSSRSEVSLRYAKLGPVAARIEAAIGGQYPSTNAYTLLFTSLSGGECQVVRDVSLRAKPARDLRVRIGHF